MSANFNGYSPIWAMWQIHSTGRALYIHLSDMIESTNSGQAGGVNFNTGHLETMYNMVRNASTQVEDVISNSSIADVKRLAEAIKGEATADYIADVQAWRSETLQLVGVIEGLYPRTGNPQFPEAPSDLPAGQLNALKTRLTAIKSASE